MRTVAGPETFVERESVPQDDYRVLAFASRSAAVRFCLRVADALESHDGTQSGEEGEVTLWLAAADGVSGAIDVYASERALIVAQAAGISCTIGRRVNARDLPAARCLILGDNRLLER